MNIHLPCRRFVDEDGKNKILLIKSKCEPCLPYSFWWLSLFIAKLRVLPVADSKVLNRVGDMGKK